MGVIYSQVQFDISLEGSDGNNEGSEQKISVSNERLRIPLSSVTAFVKHYLKFKYAPIIDYLSLHGFFQTCAGQSANDHQDLVYILWKIFAVQTICYIQEVLVCLVLVCDGTWLERLTLIFMLFKAQGIDEVSYDDILLLVQISAVSLYKLWMVPNSWNQGELNKICEGLADGLYTKLEKDLEEGVTQTEFLNWAQERFKPHRTVATPESLKAILNSQYE